MVVPECIKCFLAGVKPLRIGRLTGGWEDNVGMGLVGEQREHWGSDIRALLLLELLFVLIGCSLWSFEECLVHMHVVMHVQLVVSVLHF